MCVLFFPKETVKKLVNEEIQAIVLLPCSFAGLFGVRRKEKKGLERPAQGLCHAGHRPDLVLLCIEGESGISRMVNRVREYILK